MTRIQKELIQSASGHGLFLAGLFLFMIVTSQTSYRHDRFVTVQLKNLGGLSGPAGSGLNVTPPKMNPSPAQPVSKPAPVTAPKKESVPQPPTQKIPPKTLAPAKPQPVKPSAVKTQTPGKAQTKIPSLSERLKNRLTEVKNPPSTGKFIEPQKWTPPSNQNFVEPQEWMKTQKAGSSTSAQTQMSASVSSGPGSGGGSGSSFGKEFPFAWYLDLIQNKITMNWKEPPKPLIKEGNLSAIVSFIIYKDGHVDKIRMTERSTLEVLNQSVIEAVQTSVPLPPLPENFQDSELTINIKFELTE